MRLYWCFWVLIGPYAFLCILRSSMLMRSLSVFMSPSASLCFFMAANVS